MANDGKIYITISDTRDGSGGGVGNDADDKKKTTIGDFAKHKFFNLIQSEAKQLVNTSINNIGYFTGNYQAQRDAQVGMNLLNMLINMGTSAYAGFKATGTWQGAVIAVAVSTISQGINIGVTTHRELTEVKRNNAEVKILRERLGLESLTNGSRTGGY